MRQGFCGPYPVFDGSTVARRDSEFDKLVLVVHGVGDPEPGETLDCFARAVADRDRPLVETHHTMWLREKSPDEVRVASFGVPLRQMECGGQRVELAELFWGDLSRVRRGWLGILRGLFQIVFGLRYVAYVAADQPGGAAFRLKQLGLLSSRIVHGPALAVTFFLALLTIAVYASQLLWFGSYRGQLWTQVVISVCCIVALLSAEVGCRVARSRVVERFWFWVSATNVFVTGLMICKAMFLDQWFPEQANYSMIYPGLIAYCRILVVLLGLLWTVEMGVLLLMAVYWLLASLDSRVDRTAVHTAFLLPAASIGFWSQLLPVLWLTVRQGLNRIAELPEYLAIFDELIPLLGVQFMMTLVLGAVGVGVLAQYLRWRGRISRVGKDDRSAWQHFESDPPRLIVHAWLQRSLGFVMLVGIGLTLAVGVLQFIGHPYEQTRLGVLMAAVNKYAIAILLPAGSILFLGMKQLRPVFDIVLDVVNYFYFRSTTMTDVLDDDDEFDIAETTFQNGTLFFNRRDRIHYRLKRILSQYRDVLNHRPELVVVSHSQGTMVAIDTLNDADLTWLNQAFSKVTLITMGSPFSHLYQHYFRHLYPSLSHPHWQSLRAHVDEWLNVYRVDDFVGTRIDFAPAIALERSEADFGGSSSIHVMEPARMRMRNLGVGPRGHQGYWCDRDVLEIIRPVIAAAATEAESDAERRAA